MISLRTSRTSKLASLGRAPLGRRGTRWALAATALAACVGAPSEARAQEKQGNMFANFGLGPSFFLTGGGTQFHIQLQGGLEVNKDLYVTFMPTFGFGAGTTTITLPIGLQYDIPIRSVPNLYVYPRGEMGVGIFTNVSTPATFVIIPSFGIKYVIDGKFNVGFEPFSIPIYVAGSPFPTSQYRLTFLGGLNF
jgi:hypothetical protein